MPAFKTLRSALGAAVLITASLAAQAAPTLWLSDGNNQLATVDVATGATTVIGGTSGIFMTDIAFNPAGDLYGISFSALYSIDKLTAASTLIGNLGTVSGTANGLVFAADGTLYMAGDKLYTVNTATGAATAVTGAAMGFQSAGDLAFVGGDLYMAASNGHLVEINLGTGVATDIGDIGVGGVFGLATPDNVNLYGMAGQSVLSINIGTGAGTLVSTFNPAIGFAAGSAFQTEAGAPLPEPATLALVGLALLGAATVRRRATRAA